MINICYIDDIKRDRERYSPRLSNSQLKVWPMPPPQIQELPTTLTGLQWKPDLFLIDYELTKREQGREPVTYYGGALANAIREARPDHPVVLLSRQSLLRKPEYRRVSDVELSFDELLYKDVIESTPKIARALLISLSVGFRHLRQKKKRDLPTLLNCLGAKSEEADLLLKAAPPLRSESRATTNEWRVADAARWMRNVIIQYPGILYDELHAATALGIAVESFHKAATRKLFEAAKYNGIFQPIEGRWWRNRLYAIVQKIIIEAGLSGPASHVFAEAYKKRFHVQLKPAKCVSSGETPADWVCYILQRPVKRQFSLLYYPDARPSVMDEARVSFKAIREDRRVLDELFDDEAQQLLDEIRQGK